MINSLLTFLSPYGIRTEMELLTASSYTMIFFGLAAFLALLYVPAPYGKYAEKAEWFYGFLINGKAAWIIQECPSFALAFYYWYSTVTSSSTSSTIVQQLTTLTPRSILLGMYLFHYFNRSFIYPMLIRGGKDTPIVVMLMALVFCVWNGYMQGSYLTQAENFETNILAPHFVIGFTLFFTGLTINWQADSILRNLRKPGETGYKIPYGGMFNYVSGANFCGEIIEWTGFAIAGWNLPAFAFALFTFCNIGPRGAQHHQYYQQKFKDYPTNRKAVIPFIW